MHTSLKCMQHILHCHLSLLSLLHALASERTSTLLQSPCQPRWLVWLVLVAVCRSNMALGSLKVGHWSRKAGGRCIRCSFCVELSVHGKTVVKSRWSVKPENRLHQVLLYFEVQISVTLFCNSYDHVLRWGIFCLQRLQCGCILPAVCVCQSGRSDWRAHPGWSGRIRSSAVSECIVHFACMCAFTCMCTCVFVHVHCVCVSVCV